MSADVIPNGEARARMHRHETDIENLWERFNKQSADNSAWQQEILKKIGSIELGVQQGISSLQLSMTQINADLSNRFATADGIKRLAERIETLEKELTQARSDERASRASLSAVKQTIFAYGLPLALAVVGITKFVLDYIGGQK